MKQNFLEHVTGFILKYIWVFCISLITLELVSITYTANILMQQSAGSVMQSVSGEVSGRVDGVLRLLHGLAADKRYSDTSIPLWDRVTHALPYQESYNLYMIAMTDENMNVVSADETAPPTEPYSLAYRDYMQKLYSTGETQITDAFLSGDTKNIMNYTIAVPIAKNGKVEGSIFGSIRFQDIENILAKQSQYDGHKFYLFGENNTIMAGDAGELYGKTFLDLGNGSHYIGQTDTLIHNEMIAGKSGDFWQWDNEGLFYVTYQQVKPTNWTIMYRVKFFSVFIKLLPAMCIKICIYITICITVFLLGSRYLKRHFAQVNHLINRMSAIQTELFQSERPDYDNLLELTQQGLSDHLTGLSTRAVLFKKVKQSISSPQSYGALVFIDLDDLKRINDNFGHEGGDCSLLHFAQILKEYEQKYNAIAARYGGDEFILILNSIHEREAAEIVQNLCTALNITVTVKDHTFSIHGSLGVSFYPEHGTSLEDLICKADLALYSAKQRGKNQCAFYKENSSLF